MLTYVFDLDGTLCTIAGLEYEKAIPLLSRIDHVNSLYDRGHTIIVQTARGWSDSKNREAVYDLTKSQLDLWGLRYHHLYVATKAPGDLYVDDKGISAHVYFS
jgi:hypothetical protein